MISLITTVYPFRSPDRLQEVRTCIEQNVVNPLVDRVYILAENLKARGDLPSEYSFLINCKIELIQVSSRPTFKKFFDLASDISIAYAGAANLFSNAAGTDCPSNLVAIVNSDCYFDGTIALAKSIKEGQLWCLCRHNVVDGCLSLEQRGEVGSADAWIFRAPLRKFDNDIEVGVLGCDSYLAQKAAEAGIWLANPCREVVLRHLHKSEERSHKTGASYQDKADYKYFCVPPSKVPR